MPMLSVILITKNEAETLPGCIASVRGVADEVVVVDTGSTDGTVEIARAAGAVVSHFEWCDDFAAARNASIAAARGDWLLHLDADEALDPVNAAAIRALVDADGAGADAVEVTLANYCDDARAWRWVPCAGEDPFARGFSGYVKTTLLRLFRNGRGFEYREPVHENITQSVIERGGVIAASDILIHHYGYSPSPEVRARKARQYLGIARAKAGQHPGDTKALLDLAEQAFACGETAEAEDASRRALAIDPQHLPTGTMLANILLNRGELDAARALIGQLPPAPHLLTALGAIHIAQGRHGDAEMALAEALRLQAAAPMALLYVARLRDLNDDCAGAEAALRAALGASPRLEETRQRIAAHEERRRGEGLLAQGRAAEALPLLTAALRLDREDPLLYNALGVALHALGHAEKARENFMRALQLAPGLAAAQENLRGG